MNNLNTARISIAQRPEVKVPIDDTATSALDVFGTESNVIDSATKADAAASGVHDNRASLRWRNGLG